MLIGRFHRLPDGRRVRLRLPHVGDATAVRGLTGVGELEARRALRADVAVCALAWDGAHEVLVGCGHLTPGRAPSIAAVDPEVAALVERGLAEWGASRRRVA